MKILKKGITLFLIIIMTLSIMPVIAIADTNDSKLLNSFNQKVSRTYSTSGGDPMEITFELYKGFSPDNSEYLDYIEKVVVGNYSSLVLAENQRDIKNQIFAIDYNVRGYFANYKDGVSFTFFYGQRGVRVVNVKAVEGEFASDYEAEQNAQPDNSNELDNPEKEPNYLGEPDNPEEKSDNSNEPDNPKEKSDSSNEPDNPEEKSGNSNELDNPEEKFDSPSGLESPKEDEKNNNDEKITISPDGENDEVIDINDGKQIQLPPAVKYVPYESIIKVGDGNYADMKIISGKFPDGITFDGQSGVIYGIPKETGIFNISINLTPSQTINFILNVDENSKNNIDVLTDKGYEIIISIPDVITEYSDYVFEIEGEFNDFRDLWIDGDKKIRDVDYTAEEGSTKITIQSQTFRDIGNGTHTIAAEFHVDGDSKKIKRAVQNYTVNVNENSNPPVNTIKTDTINPNNENKNNNKSNENKSNENNVENINSIENFSDVDENAWYSADVKWVCQNKLMYGVGNGMFEPNTYTTRAMSITTLARMSQVNLESHQDDTSNKWYTESVDWAKNIGILDNQDFDDSNFDSLYSREKFAIIVYRYLSTLNVKYNITETLDEFSDINGVSEEGIRAFKMLCQLGIFYGESENIMNPDGNITRAQLAAILHRISDFSANKN